MKKALITGGNTGLGAAFVTQLRKLGYETVTAGRRDCDYLQDLSQPGAGEELYAKVRGDGHDIDLLICNAGLGLSGDFAAQDPEKLNDLIGVNITALTVLNRLFAAEMLKKGEGHIVNISSTGGFQPGPYMAAYYASKAYVLSLTRALAVELKGSGVTVTAVCPGAIATGFSNKAGRKNPKNAMDPQKIAQISLKGILKGKPLITPGPAAKLCHLYTKLTPSRFSAWAVARYQKHLNW